MTTADGVVRVCTWDHDLITYSGCALEPLDDGAYRLVRSTDPDDPERGPPGGRT